MVFVCLSVCLSFSHSLQGWWQQVLVDDVIYEALAVIEEDHVARVNLIALVTV